MGNHLQDGFLFGLEGLSVGDGAGLLQILLGCCFTTKIQIKLVVMDVSVSLYVLFNLSAVLAGLIFVGGFNAVIMSEDAYQYGLLLIWFVFL